MKSLSDILNKTPWWALLFGGIATFVALAVFVTPYHIIQYRETGKSEEESRAIKREIDNAFAENAINVGRSVVRGMLARTTDPERRAELELALQGLEEARTELREAGAEILQAKREALEAARQGVEEVRQAVTEAQAALEVTPADKGAAAAARAELREAQRRLKAAQRVERQARRELERAQKSATIRIGPSAGDQPMLEIEIDRKATPDAPAQGPATETPEAAAPPANAQDEAASPTPALPPEVASRIRRDVTRDMYRIGIGAGLLLVVFPLFVLAIIAKFFIDRSRASQRMAESKRREAEYARMSQQVTQAKLAALQAQVEPHFLYNTLASVQALTEIDPARAHEMTGHLIQYLRNALPKMRESVSTVGQEVELVRAYLSILQMRMGPRLAFSIAVPESLAALPFPPLMLPSLVENAIKHGLEPQREGGAVHISADLAGDRLRLVVADTGRGFAETVGAGVGLANIRERLAALYGGDAKLTLEANTPRGVVAAIEVPAAGARAAAGAPEAAPSGQPSPGAAPPAASPDEAALAAAPQPRGGFWARTWSVLVAMERVWRQALYWLYLVLLGVAGIAAIAALVGIAVGAIPLEVVDAPIFAGPGGGLLVLAGLVVAFFAAALALAIVIAVLYAVGYVVLAAALVAVLATLIGMLPILAPVALVVLFVWWMAHRRKAQPEPPAKPAPGPGR